MDIKAVKGRVLKQLVEGYEFATRLHQLLLSKPFHDHSPLDPTRIVFGSGSGLGPGPADELMAKILGSFDRTISVLGSFEPVAAAVPVEGSRNTSSDESPAAVSDGRCEDSGDSRKRPLGVNNKGKRGCYKRKRRSQSWTVESSTLEDAHAWRKYGQKDILNAKYPRSYFRCSNKYTHGCKAVKQVQKLEHDPGLFQITYIGNHTCDPSQETLTKTESSEIVVDSENTCGSCVLISLGDDDIDRSKAKQDDNSSVTMAVEAVKEEETGKGDEYETCPSTGDLSLVWQDFMSFDEDEPRLHGVDMADFMVFGRGDFAFGDNDEQFSFSDAYCV